MEHTSEAAAPPAWTRSLPSLRLDAVGVDGTRFDGPFAGAAPREQRVVKPADRDDVERIIRWARRDKVPLTTLSSCGPGRRRGVDRSRPTLTVDLSTMKRILHIDRQDMVAIIEPGLTFVEFDAALAAHGLRSFKPLLPRRGKSVIASHLEREPLVNASEHWDVEDPLSAAEIVFGTGEVFRTGTAGLPGTVEEHMGRGLRYLVGLGPMGTDFMRVLQGSQGTLGIVTWAAVLCEPIPAVEVCRFIGSDELEPLLRISTQINYRRYGSAHFIVNRRHLATMMTPGPSAADAMMARLPRWVLFVCLASAAEFAAGQIDYEAADLEVFANSEGLAPVAALADVPASAVVALQAAPPEPDYRLRHASAYSEVFFIHQLTGVPKFLGLAVRHAIELDHVGVYLQPRLQGRNCHIEFTLPWQDSEAASNAARRANAFAQACCDAGALFSRPYGAWARMAFEKNSSIVPFMHKTKAMLDPDGVLAPGRLCF